MSHRLTGTTRRSFVKKVSVFGLAGGVFSSIGSASRKPGTEVSVGTARRAARRTLREVAGDREFGPWEGASLESPNVYVMPVEDGVRSRYERSAYVFPVSNSGSYVGYVTAAAQQSWAPVLEYSRAQMPGSNADSALERRSLGSTGRNIYTGSLAYGRELTDGTTMRAIGGKKFETPEHVDASAFDMATDETGRTPSTSSDVTTSGTETILWDVPAFEEEAQSDNNGPGSYPGCVGPADDPWDNWDGCIPYAAANVLAYHENIDQYDWAEREALIDRMHVLTNTSDDGWTEWPDIAPGIEDYDAGSNSYNANTSLWLTPGDMKNSIEDDRPVILNMNDGGGKDDKSGESYGDHSVAAVGYDERSDGTYWAVNDGWVTWTRWLQGGNWGTAKPTYVSVA